MRIRLLAVTGLPGASPAHGQAAPAPAPAGDAAIAAFEAATRKAN